MTHAKHHRPFLRTWAIAALAVILIIGAGCDTGRSSKSTGSGSDSAPAKQEFTSEAGDPVGRCMDAYNHLFGPDGCLPDQFPPERLETACENYAAWAERGENCGAAVLAAFYTCLGSIDCAEFEKDKYGLAEFPKDYDDCQKQFARDMNSCIDERAEKQK